MSKKGCKWNNCPNYATTFVDMGNRQVPACGGCKRGSMTLNPQATTLDEIFGELLAEGMEQGCVTDINGEAMISHQYLIGYLEPKIQALINEAKKDELRRADQNAHKIKDYFKQRLRMIEIDESAIKLEGEK